MTKSVVAVVFSGTRVYSIMSQLSNSVKGRHHERRSDADRTPGAGEAGQARTHHGRPRCELFAEHGVGGVTTQQVADRADVTIGTLYLYASTKAELLIMVQNRSSPPPSTPAWPPQPSQHRERAERLRERPCAALSPAAAPGRDGSVDVGLDAGGDVGGGVEQPLQPDPVQHGGDQADFDVDLGRGEWCHVAGIDRLLQVGGEGGEVVGIAALDEGVGRVGGAGCLGGDGGEQLEQAAVAQMWRP